jgi:hypothetical protein
MKLAARKVSREIVSLLDRNARGGFIHVERATLAQWAATLAPPEPRRRKAPPSGRKILVGQLDALCREVVFLRDKATCRHCGKPARDWSHVYTRAKYGVRWDLDNSFAACRACHCWWHENPVDGALWWEKVIGTQAFSDLIRRSNRRTKPDLVAVKLYLEGARKEL